MGMWVDERKKIHDYEEFVEALRGTGMSVGGGNGEGIFTLCDYYDDVVQWHTEDRETDPWEWRMRILDEQNDIAYAKLFFKKSGYLTQEWYPCFYAVRRRGRTFAEEYEDGTISHAAKRIYTILEDRDSMALHELKQAGEFSKEEKSVFERALTELQMKLYITMCGRSRKQSKTGEEYGWSSTVFCRTEQFFADNILEKAADWTAEAAYEKIAAHIAILNPNAEEKKIKKFICG